MSRRNMIFVGSCIVGLVAGVTSLYRRDIRAAYRRLSSGSLIADTPCGQLEYAETGRGSPVLVVHGAGGGFDQGVAFGKELAQRGMRVVAMSRFGYLRTPMPTDPSPSAQADAHVCLLDALGIQKATVIGASAGAPSAMQMAIRHPDRVQALVLVVPAAYAPRPQNAPSLITPRGTEFLFSTALKSDFVFWAARQLAPETMIRAILATPPQDLEHVSPAERARVAEMLNGILPVRPRRLGLINDAAITSTLPRYELERISIPTLIMSVADDQFGTFQGARYSAEHIPNARFVGYATGGHIWVGHQDQLLGEIASFVNQWAERPTYELPGVRENPLAPIP
jgi:2-hydroxy-6-oxonona-2,4-dienedioate hydrolase